MKRFSFLLPAILVIALGAFNSATVSSATTAENSPVGEGSGTSNLVSATQACRTVAGLDFCANTITPLGGSVYEYTGDVNINSILWFEGNYTVNENDLTISGNGKIEIRDIPVPFGPDTVIFWDGDFDVDLVDTALAGFADWAGSSLSAAGFGC